MAVGSSATGATPRPVRDSSAPQIHVMVVDDSAVVRGLITRLLESDPGIKVMASVANGQLAVSQLSRSPVDVIVLDIEMPVMDGLTALPKLLEVDPGVKVIMASTLTLRNAEVSIRALELGAADYIPKPSASRDISGGADFRRELLEKVRTFGEGRSRERPRTAAKAPVARPMAPRPAAPITLRKEGTQRPDILAIGSSTGGPQALLALFKAIPSNMRIPIVITQHMPATFTAVLADHIRRVTGWPCTEAEDGAAIEPGRVYVAPGDFHLVIEAKGTRRLTRLTQAPPENFCRPSVDPMLKSVARIYGPRALAAILTGMGSDGLEGAKAVVAAGGDLVAQDERSSVVWGMPGAVATAGLCCAVLPLDRIAPFIVKKIGVASG